jgi:RNA-directed DNA polymerase
MVCSYGFRPGRCTMDAIVALHATLAPAGASGWLLDADISGCFENIGHDPLLARLPVFTTAIRRWLKAGTVNLGTWTPTEAGAPQGSPLSPVLANIALDGMERLFGAEDDQGRYVRPSGRRGLDHGTSLIRYADDLVVTAPTQAVLETYVVPKLTAFLGERGLKLSEAKTRMCWSTCARRSSDGWPGRRRGCGVCRPVPARPPTRNRAADQTLCAHPSREGGPGRPPGAVGGALRGGQAAARRR